MFIPIGDSPNPERFRPYVNWGLIALNVAIYLLIALPLSLTPGDPGDPLYQEYLRALGREIPQGLSAYDLFVFAHGYKPAAPSIADLLSAMFMHGGFMHLAGNMLFLWIYGDNVEHRLGRLGYLAAYLITGAAATVVYGLFAQGSMIPLVGASGAISGVLGLYFVMFPKNKVKVFIALFPFFFNVVLLPARLVLGFYVIVQNFLPFLFGAASSVAYGAHLGGFFAGLGIAFLGERLGWQRPGQAKLQAPEAASYPDMALSQAIETQDQRTAFLLLQQGGMKLTHELSALQCATLASWLMNAQHPGAAAELLRRCIARHRGARGPAIARVYLMLGQLRLSQGQPTSAYQYLLSALDLEPDPKTEREAHEALGQINVYRR